MQTINYWKQFEHTGKVEDYLSYVSGREYTSSQITKEDNGPEGQRQGTGVNPYAGIHIRDGNRVETDAYRGI